MMVSITTLYKTEAKANCTDKNIPVMLIHTVQVQ